MILESPFEDEGDLVFITHRCLSLLIFAGEEGKRFLPGKLALAWEASTYWRSSGLVSMKQKDFRFSSPNPEELFPAVVCQLGYPSDWVVRVEVDTEIRRAITFCLQQIRPQFYYKMTPFLSRHKGVFTGQGIGIQSLRWANLINRLEKPELLCCFIVTLGKELDSAIADLQKDSIFQSFLLDAVGSVVIEQVMIEQMTQYLNEMMGKQGYQTTARFSPGYCDWELKTGQEALFSFLSPERIGVERTPSGMMVPRKTISAVMVGAQKVPWKTPCPFCSDRECPYRRDIQEKKGPDLF